MQATRITAPTPAPKVKVPQSEAAKLERLREELQSLGNSYITKTELAKRINVAPQWLSMSENAIALYDAHIDKPRLDRLNAAISELLEQKRLVNRAALAQMADVGIVWLSSAKAAVRAFNDYHKALTSPPLPTKPNPQPEFVRPVEQMPLQEPTNGNGNGSHSTWHRQELKTVNDQLTSTRSMLTTSNGEISRLRAENAQLRADLDRTSRQLDQARQQLAEQIAARQEKLSAEQIPSTEILGVLGDRVQAYIEKLATKQVEALAVIRAIDTLSQEI